MTNNRNDDQVLIERARKGDQQAFNDLVFRYENQAYKYAFRLAGNADEASDIVSDAMIRVFNALANFKGESAFSTWLYRIITNCYLDARKRDKSRYNVSIEQAVVTESGSEIDRQIVDTSDSTEELTERNERERLVQTGLLRLPEYQRAMLVMYHVDNLGYEEIADALDLPLGTVKSRLNRARLALRDVLQKDRELFNLG